MQYHIALCGSYKWLVVEKSTKKMQKLRVMETINKNPQCTSRRIAQKVEISNGSAYYLLTALVDKGLVKLSKYKDNLKKIQYS